MSRDHLYPNPDSHGREVHLAHQLCNLARGTLPVDDVTVIAAAHAADPNPSRAIRRALLDTRKRLADEVASKAHAAAQRARSRDVLTHPSGGAG